MSRTTRGRLAGLLVAAAVVIAACGGGAASPAPTTDTLPPGASAGPGLPVPPTSDVTLQGAGATFPALLYQVWIEKFAAAHPNVQIAYQGIGSGGGIKAITQGTVDFGASDAPMKDEEIAGLPAGSSVIHVPTALGAVVVIFNLKGVADLNLDADNVANIFLGRITAWDDPAIAANNPGLALPDTAILVVHRSDGSGTTNAFTTYLDTVSPEWHGAVGKGKEVKWPTGTGAPGNDGVASTVKQNDGAVGYVELEYAKISQLMSARLENAAGQFVAGSTDGVTAAAEAIAGQFPEDFRQGPIINGAGDATYPIASYTYILAYADQPDAAKGQALVSFLAWALTDGQAEERALGYAPLPEQVRQLALGAVHEFTTGGSPVWP